MADTPAIYVQAGRARGGTDALTLGATLPWQGFRRQLWGGELRGHWDLYASRWSFNGAAQHDSTVVLGITPTLRLRPDRIVVGEVRDGAALEVLKAWNTGHPGGLLTLHANSAADALMRLEDLCMEARATPPKRLIASAVDIIVFIARREGGRVITEILEADEVRGEGA